MQRPEPTCSPNPAQEKERGSALALLPIAVTSAFYALPDWLQEQRVVQFTPQLVAYLACMVWAGQNRGLLVRFGLETHKLLPALRSGLLIGLGLGILNSFAILKLFTSSGFDISFLKETPHARVPLFFMVPWFICLIAVFVEVNFRGFLLGRLLAMCRSLIGSRAPWLCSSFAIIVSALVFAFDPFLTRTFLHLHWIAVWDGVVWGTAWVVTRNLYLPITAHAVEVLIMYSAVRAALM